MKPHFHFSHRTRPFNPCPAAGVLAAAAPAVWLLALLPPGTAPAATVTIPATADTAIFSENSENNFGNGNLIAGTNAFGGQSARSLLLFNVRAAIPAGNRITSAVFEIGIIRQSNRNVPSAYELHRWLKPWTEGGGGSSVATGSPAAPGESTWNSQAYQSLVWSTPGGQAGVEFSAAASATGSVIDTGNALYTIASTPALVSDVQGWLNSPATNHGWMLASSAEGLSGTARRFSSTEELGTGAAPRLIVTFSPVPEPATFLLFALAAAPACLRRTGVKQAG